MVDVKNKRCPCGKQTIYGLPGERPTCCKECKTDEMVDVKNKKCPCGKYTTFGIPGEQPKCCIACKTSGMVNVKKEMCSCGKQPTFGLPGERPTCCTDCKEDGMINVVDKKCPCGKIPSFGLPGERPTCCKECKTSEMMNVVNKKCPCGKIPSFGLPGERPTCCKECKTGDMTDVRSKKCPGYNGISCPVITQLYDGNSYCVVCDPDDTRRNKRKVDEEAFFQFLMNNGIDTTQREFRIEYRCIDTGGKYSLIDGVIITKDIVICLEVDEDAHAHYDPVCEQTRMNDATAELRLEYQGQSIAWVRINPNITNKTGKRDRTTKGTKVRDSRHEKALGIIRKLLATPMDCVKYVGY
jgi:hypothetical protein